MLAGAATTDPKPGNSPTAADDLRISAAGMERNVRSPATYLNQNRDATVAVPAIADADAVPEWRRISAGRTVHWHDHRIHWMDTVAGRRCSVTGASRT